MTCIHIAVVWIVCGIYNFGTERADFAGKFPNSNQRENLGFCAFMALIGPIGFLVSLLATNFNQHGWRLK